MYLIEKKIFFYDIYTITFLYNNLIKNRYVNLKLIDYMRQSDCSIDCRLKVMKYLLFKILDIYKNVAILYNGSKENRDGFHKNRFKKLVLFKRKTGITKLIKK